MKSSIGMARTAFVLVAAIAGATAYARPASAQAAQKTVVLVHGAFADGSSWAKVIPILEAKGLKVIAVQNPLTSLADDVAATKRALAAVTGPVVLVGHSWGGVVITEAGNDDKVGALVYVAAFAPDDGQAVGDLGKDLPPPPGSAGTKPDAAGFIWLSDDVVAKHFAQDLPAAEAKLIAATQGPVAARCFGDKVTTAAWKKKPSYAIVASKDHMIQPELETSMAKKMNATVTTLPTSHVAMLAKPKEVAAVIISAAEKLK